MLRNFIEIDEDKCNGCGQCVTACAEGALAIIDGKAKVVNEIFCDGLGACIGHCPEDALHIVEKDVAAYDEAAVEANTQREAVACHCPGAAMMDFRENVKVTAGTISDVASELRQWPVQLHLVNPAAPYFQGANLLIAADCAAFAYGNFHKDYLAGKAVVIACPKLDRKDNYVAKLAAIIRDSKVASVTVVRMEVPCCGGLAAIAQEAIVESGRKVPYLEEIISIDGKVK